MNRRSFLTILGAAAPTLFLPKLIKPGWKPLRPAKIEYFKNLETVYHINPAWVDARYEWMFFQGSSVLVQKIVCRDGATMDVAQTYGYYPVRGDHLDQNGQIIPICPWIKINPENSPVTLPVTHQLNSVQSQFLLPKISD
jgi:hypothetical protein